MHTIKTLQIRCKHSEIYSTKQYCNPKGEYVNINLNHTVAGNLSQSFSAC